MYQLKYLINNNVICKYDDEYFYSPFISSFVPNTYILEDDIFGNIKTLSDDEKKVIIFLENLKICDFTAVSCTVTGEEFNKIILFDNDKEIFFYEDKNVIDYSVLLNELDKNNIRTVYDFFVLAKID